MKKMHKLLATTSILAMAAMPMAAYAQEVPTATSYHGSGVIQNQFKAVPGTIGQITDFVNDKTGKFITVTGRGLTTTDQKEIVLSITKNTKIVNSRGKTVALKTIIDEKKVVKAFYSPAMTKSIPAQSTALTLVVQDQSFTAINGTVTEVQDNGILVKGKDIYSGNEATIVLHFAKKAQILGQDGKAIKASDIQKGMNIQAFYGPAVTMSLPPQSTTNYVIVNKQAEETVTDQAVGTSGIITEVKDNKVTLMGKGMEKGGVDYVILTVDKDTEIVNEEGKAVTAEALKADVSIDATYGEAMTMIFPAQTHADKIVVKAKENMKVVGTVIGSDSTSEDQVYVNVGTDQNVNNDVILNITKDTKIIHQFGGSQDLKPGAKIVAYHSPMMTRSLPGITNAELIMITSNDNLVAPR
ncbi:hypothetical protein [Paenibacillus pini]|uniref:Peptidase n=1 Tax=Paenibacillus pini JCM 16418 TaxID=1236976 RepID=W7YCC9_9BACL|nr:hypothetical protein [Paenibacillus pini]GAF06102.1 hypothetical protein JCM16418_45 [Paenibacillus pini JCM 16418]